MREGTRMTVPSQQTLLLLLVVLLLLWLLTRREAAVKGHERRKPITEGELGRVVFEVARAGDLEAFRHLYLSGGEARELLGDGAAAYLDKRGKQWLEEEFLEVAVRVAAPVRYEGARVAENGATVLLVHSPVAGAYELPVGRALRVGRIWRIVEPVGDWRELRQLGAPVRASGA